MRKRSTVALPVGVSPCTRRAPIDPSEMLVPVLCARIKEGHGFSRFRIKGSSGCCLAEITSGTGEAQISGIIAPLWINMLNMHRLADCIPTRLAVFTAIPSTVVDQAHNACPGQFTHEPRRERRE